MCAELGGAVRSVLDRSEREVVGNVVFQKFPTLTQDLSRRCIATRGGEHLHTLEDRKAEAFDNAVDVVELLLVSTDQAPNVRHLRVLHMFSPMTSLELLIQQRVEGEFCQHDGMVTVMVK